MKDLTGQRFTRLTVISRAESKGGRPYWNCLCDCGNTKVVRGSHLTDGSTKSCGCWNKEVQAQFYRRFEGKPKSQLHSERLYRIWRGLRGRCNNPKAPKYHRYGGRGIRVCPEWDDYKAFKSWALNNGYADNLSIDRIDNDGDYSPKNCRWATAKEQGNNTSKNHKVTINGETHTISEWASLTGISGRKIWARIHYGFTGEDLVSKENLRWKKAMQS